MNELIFYLHPIFASFPFAILLVVFLTELACYFADTAQWRIFSCFLVCIATILSLATYYTGFFSATNASLTFQVSEEVISMHQVSAKLYLLSIFPTVLFSILRAIKQSELLHWFFVPCLICSLLLSGLASHRGGMLVFQEGAGVQRECPACNSETKNPLDIATDK